MSTVTIEQKELSALPGPTDEEVAQKVTELESTLKSKVHAFVFLLQGKERIAGYLREPQRMEKVQFFDRVMVAPATAAMIILDACLIKEASDPRITAESSEYDTLHLGAIQFVQNLMTLNYDVYKKK